MNGVEVMKFGRMMRACFKRYGAPDRVLEDVESIAILAVLETHKRKRLPLTGNRGYYFAAATREIAEEIKHLLAPYRVGGRAARLGVFQLPETMPFRPELRHGDEKGTLCLAEILASTQLPVPTPDDVLRNVASERARARVIRRVLGHAQGMPPRTQKNVAHLLQAIAPGVKVPRRKPTRNAAWNGVARLRNLVAKNERARRDRAVMINGEEAAA